MLMAFWVAVPESGSALVDPASLNPGKARKHPPTNSGRTPIANKSARQLFRPAGRTQDGKTDRALIPFQHHFVRTLLLSRTDFSRHFHFGILSNFGIVLKAPEPRLTGSI
jgi:hypothetical protein